MIEFILNNQVEIIATITSITSYITTIYILPQKYAKYFNVLEKACRFLANLFKEIEETKGGISTIKSPQKMNQ